MTSSLGVKSSDFKDKSKAIEPEETDTQYLTLQYLEKFSSNRSTSDPSSKIPLCNTLLILPKISFLL
jgi:hypothetical protein